jgi:periplasmic divalent cation tolerance protein
MEEDYGLAIISSPAEAAETLARALVENHAAACVQIIRDASTLYWWKGQVHFDTECILLVKTLESRLEKIKFLLKEIHPYEVPELIFLRITGGSERYLEWLRNTVHHGDDAVPTL